MIDATAKAQPRLKERLQSLCVEMIEKGILYSEARDQFDRCFISEVVRRDSGNLIKAAARLGIHRNTLAKRLKRLTRH